MKDRKEIKETAKLLTKNNFSTVCIWFFITLIYVALAVAVMSTAILSVVAWAMMMLMLPAISYCALKLIREGDNNIKNIYECYTKKDLDLGTVLVVGLLKSIFIALWSLLLIIPGIIKTYAYALTDFILVDKDFNGKYTECLKLSNDMMKGYKFKLFVLQLSFIGWMILVGLTAGILGIFVYPYYYLSMAGFYEEIKAEYSKMHPEVFENKNSVEDDTIIIDAEDEKDPFDEKEKVNNEDVFSSRESNDGVETKGKNNNSFDNDPFKF